MDIACLTVRTLQLTFEFDHTSSVASIQTQRPQKVPLRVGVPQRAGPILVE